MSIENELKQSLGEAIRKAGFDVAPDAFEITETRQKGHGDLTTNASFAIAKAARMSPRAAAEKIAGFLTPNPSRIEKIEVAGNGFINFTLGADYLSEALTEILRLGPLYGRNDSGKGRKTMVEFVSANPTGPLTIGHGRQAVIGDVVSRLLDAAGHQVTREYYFNNAGRQMRVLGESVRLRYLELLGRAEAFPEDHYQGEYIRDIAAAGRKERGDGSGPPENLPYFQQLAENTIFADIRKTLERLGIRFDVYFNERSLYDTGRIDAVIAELRKRDLAYDSEGAVWFRATKAGLDQDRVIVKSTGEPTYRLPDMAYHKDKYDRGFELIVDIFGADHIATYPDVMAGLKAMGYDPSRVKVLIHQFVTLTEGKEKVKMSTRKANFVTLDELMDEVGLDVTRYFFINRSMSSHLNFDLTLAKTQSDENPVYYVQYAHARISSILRKAKEEGIDAEAAPDLSLLREPAETDLARVLLSYPRVVAEAARNFEPHKVPTYLEEAATVYHHFQHAGKQDENLRVVSKKNVPAAQARLALCRATRTVLANGLGLLGISAPESM
jgi:arginyl-tRNA synthetase